MNHADPAPWATRPEHSRGRLHPEPESPTRSVFQRDRDRIVHSTAFRRLEHKTQVFVHHEGDHYRTRLTHSLEVAQIARSAARELRLNEDLAEALALAHDLGHPPFGHAGEAALNEAMAPFDGFDHNAQTLRILTHFERRYAAFDGLNLTWETLEGVAKHNGPADPRSVPATLAAYNRLHDLELDSFAGPEAQAAAQADDIAYCNHDIDDALRAGLFDVDSLAAAAPLVGAALDEVSAQRPGLERGRLVHEIVRRLIDAMVNDLVGETRGRAARLRPASAAAVRALGEPLVGFSAEMRARISELKAFLHARMYRHERVRGMAVRARRVIRDLFALFLAEPGRLPEYWARRAAGPGSAATARVAADYVAGMTDRYALTQHARLFDVSVDLR